MLLAAAVVLSGCRLDVIAATELDRDGSGTLELIVRLDDALLDELDALAIDPTLEVTALAQELDGWSLAREVDEQSAIILTLARPFADPEEVGEALRELSSGLVDDDPALLIDLELALDAEGRSSLSGSAGFRPPATIGAQIDGEPLGPSADELAALVTDMVAPALRVTLPGPITEHDADQLDGRTLTWQLPVGEQRTVTASAAEPSIFDQPWLWAAVAIGVLLVLLLVALALRRRR